MWIPPTCEQPSGLVDVVVWDFGNVLVRWDPALAVAEQWSAEEFEDLARRADFTTINRRLDRGFGVAEMLEDLTARDPDAAALWRAYVNNIRRSLVPDIVGTPELVGELSDAGIPQYGLTNWPGIIADEIPEIVPGAASLQGVVVSGLEGVVKPEPAIYEILLARYGLDPARTLFVDDREENLEAAARMGFSTFHFAGHDHAPLLRAELARLGVPVSA